jgi:hypothetical protein
MLILHHPNKLSLLVLLVLLPLLLLLHNKWMAWVAWLMLGSIFNAILTN